MLYNPSDAGAGAGVSAGGKTACPKCWLGDDHAAAITTDHCAVYCSPPPASDTEMGGQEGGRDKRLGNTERDPLRVQKR